MQRSEGHKLRLRQIMMILGDRDPIIPAHSTSGDGDLQSLRSRHESMMAIGGAKLDSDIS